MTDLESTEPRPVEQITADVTEQARKAALFMSPEERAALLHQVIDAVRDSAERSANVSDATPAERKQEDDQLLKIARAAQTYLFRAASDTEARRRTVTL